MPSFAARLTANQISALAAFVASSAASAPPPVSLRATLQPFSRAFGRYRDAVERIAAQLDVLDPPLELRAGLVVQRRALHRSVRLCTAIMAALGRKDLKTANADIHTLFLAAEQTRLRDAPRAARAALLAYNTRLDRINALAVRVAQDRTALVRTAG
jgi:hypothetical protein